MNTHQRQASRPVWAAVALAAALACVSAQAADRSDARARYEKERAACMDGQSNQNRHDCLREAGAAYNEARKGELGAGVSPGYKDNQLARCDALKGDEHNACISRMQGQGTVSGSVEGGGLYRELVTVQPAPAPAPAQAPQ